MSKIAKKEKQEYKTALLRKDSWKYLKKKSADKETSIIQELDTLVKKDKEEGEDSE